MAIRVALSAFLSVVTVAAAYRLGEKLCDGGRDTYDGSLMVDAEANVSCDTFLEQNFASYLNSWGFNNDRQQECAKSMSIKGVSMTMTKALLHLEFTCCNRTGSWKPRYGLCNDYFPEGVMCRDDSSFVAGAGLQDYHCDGDERITNETLCKLAGDGAWDPTAAQKCDIDRLWGQEWVGACERAGAKWTEITCLQKHDEFVQMGAWNLQVPQTVSPVCTSSTVTESTFEQIAGQCCKNEDGSQSQLRALNCPPPSPEWYEVKVCGGMGNLIKSNKIGGRACGDVVSTFMAAHPFAGDFQTEYSYKDCEAPVSFLGNQTKLRVALLEIQKFCCPELPLYGMCGRIFDGSGVCVNAGDFRHTAGKKTFDCVGDELIDDWYTCQKAGEEAWDPNAAEKCDLRRVKSLGVMTDAMRKIYCEEYYKGSWVEAGPPECQIWYEQLASEGTLCKEHLDGFAGIYCDRPDLQDVFTKMSETCCISETGEKTAGKAIKCCRSGEDENKDDCYAAGGSKCSGIPGVSQAAVAKPIMAVFVAAGLALLMY